MSKSEVCVVNWGCGVRKTRPKNIGTASWKVLNARLESLFFRHWVPLMAHEPGRGLEEGCFRRKAYGCLGVDRTRKFLHVAFLVMNHHHHHHVSGLEEVF